MIEYLISIMLGGFMFYYYNKKTCEDSYQHKRSIIHKNNNPVISIKVKYNNKNNLPTIYEAKQKLVNINNHFNYTNSYISTNNIFNNIEDYMKCKNCDLKILLNSNDISLHSEVDHKYIGGSKLAFCTYLSNKNIEQKDYFYNSRWYHIFPALKLLWNINKIPKVNKPLLLYNNDMDIKRYIYEYNFDRTNNVKATIIYNVMKDLYKCLNLNRPLVCYIPIAFNPTKTVYNNIGIIFLTYQPSDTIETIAMQLKNNSYMALGTNFLLYNNLIKSNNGTNVRKSVDAVITIIFSEDDIYVSKSWTFYNVSEYPVYVAISSVLNNNTVQITQTLTISTPEFDITKSELNYEMKDRNYYLLS